MLNQLFCVQLDEGMKKDTPRWREYSYENVLASRCELFFPVLPDITMCGHRVENINLMCCEAFQAAGFLTNPSENEFDLHLSFFKDFID